GKSSVVKAGLLPNLRTIAPVPKRRGKWYVAECRPRTDPGAAMLDALWRDVCAPLLSTETGQEALATGFSCPTTSSPDKTAFEEICKSRFYGLVSGPARASRGRSIQPYGIYEFANTVLDRIDYSLLEGLRAGAANLLILIDQFEEIFDDDKIDSVSRDEIVSLIDLARSNRDQGLFLVLTMRSEALHRCAEDPRLVDVVNQSSFLLELIDDRDVSEVIVRPARAVCQSWGLLPVSTHPPDDAAPFTPDLVSRLSTELKYLRTNLAYKPDSLPLLQNALEAIWANAVAGWKSKLASGANVSLTIKESDLAELATLAPSSATADPGAPHELLRRCLQQRAEDCRQRSMAILTSIPDVSNDDADRILTGAFATLAQRNDRGNWVRRFATPAEMLRTSAVGQARELTQDDINRALEPFVTIGYLQLEAQSDGSIYNVSHEALLRSWPWYEQCLQK